MRNTDSPGCLRFVVKVLKCVQRRQMYKIILTVFMLSLPAFSYAQPSIHFNELRHDFGTVSQDDKIEYIFEFSNVGNRPLIIEKISPS